MALLVFAIGCTWGPRVADLVPAQGPRGESVEVQVYGMRVPIRGELFAVDTEGVFVAAPVLTRVRWVRISSLRSTGLRKTYYISRKPPIPKDREELSAVSRFPQRLDPATLAAVLVAMRQDTLRVVE